MMIVPSTAAKAAIQALSPLLASITNVVIESVSESETVAETGDIAEPRKEAQRQDLTMSMAERQAKVVQELAIARRIESALEVEMEEFYDLSAAANAGVNTDGSNLSIGVSGKGQRVSKRIFRFKGTISPSLSGDADAGATKSAE